MLDPMQAQTSDLATSCRTYSSGVSSRCVFPSMKSRTRPCWMMMGSLLVDVSWLFIVGGLGVFKLFYSETVSSYMGKVVLSLLQKPAFFSAAKNLGEPDSHFG